MHTHRWFHTFLTGILLVSMFLTSLPANAAPQQQTAPNPPVDPIQQLKNDSGDTARVSLDPATGAARFIRVEPGSLGMNAAVGDEQSARQQAMRFLETYGGAFGLRAPADELNNSRVITDANGGLHVEYTQIYAGVPVFAGVLRVHFNATGQLTGANGTFIPGIGLNVNPRLSAQQAAALAVNHVRNPKPDFTFSNLIAPSADGLRAGDPTLLVYRENLVRHQPGANRLVYEVEVSNGLDVREFVYVDAHTGKIVDQITGIEENIHREIFNGGFDPAYLVWSEGDPWPYTGPDAEGIAHLHDFAEDIYNTFASVSNGFLSWDGIDGVMNTVYNDDDINCPNAHWTGTHTGFCPGIEGDDTVGHEWSHAYTDGTHDLIYAYQPGALNEAYSDIWAEVMDFINGAGLDDPGGLRSDGSCSIYGAGEPSLDDSYRWLSGEDDEGFGGAIRDLWNPGCYGDPSYVTDDAYYCGTGDGGGVHTNSGVPNHAFALMVDGGTFNGQTITGIGLTKASAIYWRAQYIYQVPSSDFADHADALEASCSDLIGATIYEPSTENPAAVASSEVISADDCTQVSNAITAVELREEPTQCDYEPLLEPNAPALCPAGFDVVDIEATDWESGLGTWTVGSRDVADPSTFDSADWRVVDNLPGGRPGSAVFAEDNPALGDCSADDESSVRYVESAEITIPAGVTQPLLAFDHYLATEMGYDGGNVKVSVNGGDWELLPASAYTFNAYNTTLISSGNTNPMGGEAAFSGADGGSVEGSWGQSQVDLTGYAASGDVVKIRFELGIDGCGGLDGWYVDQVEMYYCMDATAGTVAGYVTEEGTGTPIAGAKVEAGTGSSTYFTESGADGAYALNAPAGVYDVEAWAYGYYSSTASGVVIVTDETTPQDFSLSAAPLRTIAGTVTDANTGWPLYSKLVIDGYPNNPVWTDPVTGAYQVDLSEGHTYHIQVEAWAEGYAPGSFDVEVTDTTSEANFTLEPDVTTCSAPGYSPIVQFSEGFEDAFPPPSWIIVNADGDEAGNTWYQTASRYHSGAKAARHYWGPAGWVEDGFLSTPPFMVENSEFSFWDYTDYPDYYFLHELYICETIYCNNPEKYMLLEELDSPTASWQKHTYDISAYEGKEVRLVFRYAGEDADAWAIDDVMFREQACQAPTEGGLVVGNVYDANTNLAMDGAAVSNDAGESTLTAGTPDPAVDEGFYTLYSPSGTHTFEASKANYETGSADVEVVDGDTVRQDFFLGAPLIAVTPTALSSTQKAGVQTSLDLEIGNTGTAPLTWEMVEGRPYRSMTQSLSQDVLFGNSVACGSSGIHADNSYLRVFDLNAMGINGTFDVTNVQVGIESANAGDGVSQEAQLWLYTLDGNLEWANMTPIAAELVDVPDQSLSVLDIPINVQVPAGAKLVVEFYTPSGSGAGNSLYIGSNNLGQTGPTYLAAPACGIPEPMDVAAIGFPGMHLVMNVISEGTGDLPWLTLNDPATGVVDEGASQTSGVTVDSTGMAPGDYNGSVTVMSNDTTNSMVFVPVTLTVEETFGVDASADPAVLSGLPGEVVEYSVDVTNTGNVADTFDLAFSGNAWDTELSKTQVSLNPGAHETVTVSVTIPADAEDGDTDQVTLTATSSGDNTQKASVELTTGVGIELGVTAEVMESPQSGDAGTTVTYTVRVTNTGNVADTFDVAASGNMWVTALSDAEVTLAPGASQMVSVVVTVPANARNGNTDTVTITVTSQTDAEVTDAVSFTTTATANSVFLPLMTKNGQ